MPRRRRGLLNRHCYHLTHRCHRREHLFRFARDRDCYVDMLRETKARFAVDFLNYMVTSNHVHLLVWARDGNEIARAMQFLQGNFAQFYNNRKRRRREGAFWRDRYHSTLVQSGEHLARCLFYIDLNMVRAGVVNHPREWRHCGLHELVGRRQRYRVLNISRLQRCLHRTDEHQAFREWYGATLDSRLHQVHERDAMWTDAIAVGEQAWIQDVYRQFGYRRKQILAAPQITYDEPPVSGQEINERRATYYIEG